jgi:hypothetical protein
VKRILLAIAIGAAWVGGGCIIGGLIQLSLRMSVSNWFGARIGGMVIIFAVVVISCGVYVLAREMIEKWERRQ